MRGGDAGGMRGGCGGHGVSLVGIEFVFGCFALVGFCFVACYEVMKDHD